MIDRMGMQPILGTIGVLIQHFLDGCRRVKDCHLARAAVGPAQILEPGNLTVG